MKGCQIKKKSRKLAINSVSCGFATHSKGEAGGKMVWGGSQRWELFNIIPHYRTTAPIRCCALRPKGRRIMVIMLLSEAKARGSRGNIRNLIIARGGGAVLFERGRYKAWRVSFTAEEWKLSLSGKHFFKKIGDSYAKERSKKIYF